ncbi:MAG TPA: alpha-D-ribose 1-methylphosphonate 5-triphosphate diphosphatase [Candidatus Dormibacteraeota bacterium]|jgi:alpha-D-ribose 1-methylphosphonate 5-triphosphate diphosphatase|nr:alpha-D-ribose 1-methylphosphonate 5-triphosphate diphosphatase [Candidatus Dormibacteraeota bacterium]
MGTAPETARTERRHGRPVALRAARALIGGVARQDWWVVVRDGLIEEARPSRPGGVEEIELAGMDLIPGLVDLHSDCLELKTRPRPGMVLPLEAGILELDTEAASNGITTHHLCVCVDEDPSKFRNVGRTAATVRALESIHDELRVEHRIHLRVEMTCDGMEATAAMAGSPVVGLLSYMVHIPGMGQFRDRRAWEAYYGRRVRDGKSPEDEVARRMADLDKIAGRRRRVAEIAREHGLVLAAHDDDSEEAARLSLELGATISEFPVIAEAAATARSLGLGTVMGAPNARRGRSQHEGNLSAREALRAGLLSGLASDYHPASLIAAAYQLSDERECSWTEAVALVTSGPADMARLADRGRIDLGARADLAAVGRRAGQPSVAQVWVAGREVFGPGR